MQATVHEGWLTLCCRSCPVEQSTRIRLIFTEDLCSFCLVQFRQDTLHFVTKIIDTDVKNDANIQKHFNQNEFLIPICIFLIVSNRVTGLWL